MPGISFRGSKKIPWFSLGTIVQATAHGDATLGVAERNFQTNKDLTNVLYLFVPPAISAIKVRFLMTTSDEDVDIEIWQGKLVQDPSKLSTVDCDLQRKATLDVICGTQDVYGTTKHFADTINITNDVTEDGIDKSIPAAEHMATLHWDLKGDNLVVFHGFGTFDEACEIEVTGYS